MAIFTYKDGDLAIRPESWLKRLISRLDVFDEGIHHIHVRVRVTVQEEVVWHT